MVVDVLITAGGKGTRMRGQGLEKPMIPVLGRPLIDYVVKAVRGSRHVSEIYVSVSDNTSLTRSYLKERGINVVETSGKEYVQDLQQALQALRTDLVLICPADMPLLPPHTVDEIIEGCSRQNLGSVSVAVPLEVLESVGTNPSYHLDVDGEEVALCGISLVDRECMLTSKPLTEGYLVIRSVDLAVNVNTVGNLKTAERILEGRSLSR